MTSTFAHYAVAVLFFNTLLAFVWVFICQFKVITTVVLVDRPMDSYENLGRFLAGERAPDLRRRWLRAIAWLILNIVVLFVAFFLGHHFFPDRFIIK